MTNGKAACRISGDHRADDYPQGDDDGGAASDPSSLAKEISGKYSAQTHQAA